MMGMPIEVRDRWVAALRSGEYEQGSGRLKDYLGRFCCLGVLSDVLGADLDTRDERGCVPGMYGGLNYGPEVLFAVLPDKEGRCDLASLNDEGKTFAEIADYIEQNVPVS